MKIIPYSRQSIDEDDIKAVVDVLRSDFLTQGPKVQEFESALSEYCGSKYSVVFSSGTAALHAAYFAAGIGQGDEIITSPITFVATANASLYLGAKPVFADVEMQTGNIDPASAEKLITEKTKALVPVHYAGHPVDIDAIHDIAKRHNLIVIEDACHAIGAAYNGKKVGSLSDMTIFSFHPVKPITTGEGGAVLTDSKGYYEKLLMFRSHGITKEKFANSPHGDWYYEMHYLGNNYRLTDIQSAIGISQLSKLDMFIQKRKNIAQKYNEIFSGNKFFDLPKEKHYASSSWHLYPVQLKDTYAKKKDEIFRKLREKGLGVQVHYMPAYFHPYYVKMGYELGICPKAELFYKKQLSLPLHHAMSDEDIRRVIEEVNNVV